MDNQIVLYVPIDNNFRQVEGISAFLENYPAKLFFYEWNNSSSAMKGYYQKHFRQIEEFSFTLEGLITNLNAEKRKVVFLLTSFINSTFTQAQLHFFKDIIKPLFTNVIDVLEIPATSPVKFTRFVHNRLPYSPKDVRTLLEKQKTIRKINKTPSTVLICPTYGLSSFLFNSSIVNELITLSKKLPLIFMVKFDPVCYLENHPLVNLTDVERENFELLKNNFPVFDETQYNILPMLSEFDIIITDITSNLVNHSFYFGNKRVLAYYHNEQEITDEPIFRHITTFANETELALFLASPSSIKESNGKDDFEAKYGKIDGNEISKITQERHWNEISVTFPSGVTIDDVTKSIDHHLATNQFAEPVTSLHYLAIGLPIPQEISSFSQFVKIHEPQLKTMNFPPKLWKSLYNKLSQDIFDGGSVFELQYDEGYQLVLKIDLDKESDVFLVDHAWLFQYTDGQKQLRALPNLVDRLYPMMDLDVEDQEEENEEEENNKQENSEKVQNDENSIMDNKVDRIWNRLWKYAQTFKLGEEQWWYVMDEVGSAIKHEDEPNFKCLPFYYVNAKLTFSLIWPINKVSQGDIVSRDFYPTPTKTPLDRQAHLSAWFEVPNEDAFDAAYNVYMDKLSHPPHYVPRNAPNPLTYQSKYKVFTDIQMIKDSLNISPFQLVNSVDEADIIWQSSEFKDFILLQKDQIVNQFPNEQVVTFKHLLPLTVANTFGFVDWLPMTYNMETQLPEFIGDYRKREKEEEDNHWIIKPWNRSRTIDITISNNQTTLIRMSETGPKVISKYIEKPILCGGKKFDLRFIVLLKSVVPLELYVYNLFYPRLANVDYSLDNLEVFEKHFTVMNYGGGSVVMMDSNQFIDQMKKENKELDWEKVIAKIHIAILQTFQSATANDPPAGILATHQSRAIFGLDFMIDNDWTPKLLEVNFSPDTTRHCKFDKNFYNNVFTVLFLDENDKNGSPNAFTSVTRLV